jgi:hypothetical protein
MSKFSNKFKIKTPNIKKNNKKHEKETVFTAFPDKSETKNASED